MINIKLKRMQNNDILLLRQFGQLNWSRMIFLSAMKRYYLILLLFISISVSAQDTIRIKLHGSGTNGSGWSLTGNQATLPGNNFIGTTDSAGLIFKTNGIQSGFLDFVNFNASYGLSSLLLNTSGKRNTAVGASAGPDNTSGNQNTFLGWNAGGGIISGNYNTIIGANITGLDPSLSNNIIIADGQGNRRINVDSLGNVGIGTTDTKGFKFAVNGDGIFNRIRVKPYDNWPDYVFSKYYTLPDLEDLEIYLILNNHLPGVPSAADISRNGIDVGANQTILLKKIEELTLYTIEQNKKSAQQQLEIDNLELQLKKLQSVVEKDRSTQKDSQ